MWARPRGSLREWINGRGRWRWEASHLTAGWWATCGLLCDLFNKLLISGERGLVGNNESLLGAVVKVICVWQWGSQEMQYQILHSSGPNTFSTRDQFCERWFFPWLAGGGVRGGVGVGWGGGWGGGWGEGFGIIQRALYLLLFLLLLHLHLRLDPGGWGPLLYRTTTNIALPITQTFFYVFLHISAKDLLQEDPSFC